MDGLPVTPAADRVHGATDRTSSSAGVLFSGTRTTPSPARSARVQTLSALSDMLSAHNAGAPPVRSPPQNLHHVIIKQHVPYVLDLQVSNYNLWSLVFLSVLGKFHVEDHIELPPPMHCGDPQWIQDDFTVVSWLYTTISTKILTIIIAPRDSAATVWRKIEDLFLDNKVMLAVHLDAEFHSLRQGNMSVTEYCARLKVLADRLRDCDKPVSDADLVHTTLGGLHRDLRHLIPILTRERPLPSFRDVRSFIIGEEKRLKQQADAAPSDTALHASSTPAPSHSNDAATGAATRAATKVATEAATRASNSQRRHRHLLKLPLWRLNRRTPAGLAWSRRGRSPGVLTTPERVCSDHGRCFLRSPAQPSCTSQLRHQHHQYQLLHRQLSQLQCTTTRLRLLRTTTQPQPWCSLPLDQHGISLP